MITVLAYRLLKRNGLIAGRGDLSPQFMRFTLAQRIPVSDHELLIEEAEALHRGELRMFGRPRPFDAKAPNWFANRLSGTEVDPSPPWWSISDTDSSIGDIKGVWEASRFDWALVLARAARVSGDVRHVRLLERLINDWCAANPPYRGPNWMCGQECSIRLIQLLLSTHILGDAGVNPGMNDFVRQHLARILPTRFYARAQDNNHVTSEGAALFIGGAWLEARTGLNQRETSIGRRMIEAASRRLIFKDGGFAQYSTNYHRVMLDTLAQVEFWRMQFGQRRFSKTFYSRLASATKWLGCVTNSESGKAPNLGSNDGARVFRLDSLPFNDYRPTVQFAANLFFGLRAFPPGPWDAGCELMGLKQEAEIIPIAKKVTTTFPDFGLALLNPRKDGTGSYAFLRVPTRQFRPGQADPLHFDFWTENGSNLLRDGGTGSYADPRFFLSLAGIAGHNTIQFDSREPMPRLSRFLYGKWIGGTGKLVSGSGKLEYVAQYTDAHGNTHKRIISASGRHWSIRDHASGGWSEGVLRWRIRPCKLSQNESTFISGDMSLNIDGDSLDHVILDQGCESLTYGEITSSPLLIATFKPSRAPITTRITIPASSY